MRDWAEEKVGSNCDQLSQRKNTCPQLLEKLGKAMLEADEIFA